MITNSYIQAALSAAFGNEGAVGFGRWVTPKRKLFDRIFRRPAAPRYVVGIGPRVPVRWRYRGNGVENAEQIVFPGDPGLVELFVLFSETGTQLTEWGPLNLPSLGPADQLAFQPGSIRIELS